MGVWRTLGEPRTSGPGIWRGGPLGERGWGRRSWGGAFQGTESKFGAMPCLQHFRLFFLPFLSPSPGGKAVPEPFFPFRRQGPRHLQCLLAQHAGTRGYQAPLTASRGVWWDEFPTSPSAPTSHPQPWPMVLPQRRAGSSLALRGGQGRCFPTSSNATYLLPQNSVEGPVARAGPSPQPFP